MQLPNLTPTFNTHIAYSTVPGSFSRIGLRDQTKPNRTRSVSSYALGGFITNFCSILSATRALHPLVRCPFLQLPNYFCSLHSLHAVLLQIECYAMYRLQCFGPVL